MLSAACRSISAWPDSRTSCASGRDRNTRRLVCWPSGVLITVVSDGMPAVPVKPTESSGPPLAPRSTPAASAVVPCRNTSTSLVPGIGQSAYSPQTSLSSSIVTAGSLMIPLSTPYSQWSNQRWRVSTHTSRRESNGSVCPERSSHSLRGTPAALRAFHHGHSWLSLTLSSWKPCTAKTAACTLPTLVR